MAAVDPTLATIYENWKRYQDLLVGALRPLSLDQLALRAAPNLRSIGENAAHIVGARLAWFTSLLGENWDELGAREMWDRAGAPVHNAGELVRGIETSWRLICDALDRWSPEDMLQTFVRERGGQRYELARTWVIWHLLEHDLHHGGEISLTLGMHGLPAPDI
jgi:uncharacterized damage-inducible protein DinB